MEEPQLVPQLTPEQSELENIRQAIADHGVLTASIPGPLGLNYPVDMFVVVGELAYRQHYGMFMAEMSKLYDSLYEQCRVRLFNADHVIRPPRVATGSGFALIDTSAVQRALGEETDAQQQPGDKPQRRPRATRKGPRTKKGTRVPN